MTPRELFSSPAALFSPAPVADVERAKRLYLAQFAHVNCGGAPVAFVQNGALGCTGCLYVSEKLPPNAPLEKILSENGNFRSIICD